MTLAPRPWSPSPGRRDGIGPKLVPDSASPPLVLAIHRRDPAVQEVLPELSHLLSAQERARTDRYRLVEDRERFLIGRAGLRLCLGELLGRDPTGMSFGTGPCGKPFLAGAAGLPDPTAPHFNLSHAGDLILLALHRHRAVGVDVERERSRLDWRPIARRCLPVATVDHLESLPPAAQGLAFLQAWCELEATLKAAGTGLGGDAPSLSPSLWPLDLPAGYRGAVALL